MSDRCPRQAVRSLLFSLLFLSTPFFAVFAQEVPPKETPPAAPQQEPPSQQPPPSTTPPVQTPPPVVPPKEPVRQEVPAQQLWTTLCCFEKARFIEGDQSTHVFHMHHHNLDQYVALIKGHVQIVSVTFSEALSTMAVTVATSQTARLMSVIEATHHTEMPVLIQARIVELRWDKDLEIGVEGDLTSGSAIFTKNTDSQGALREVRLKFNPESAIGGTPFQGSTFRFGSTGKQQGSIGGVIQSFVERGRAQVLSNPYVFVRTGETAKIHSGQEIPSPADITTSGVTSNVTIKYKSVGVSLDVTPHLSSPGQVILNLKPNVSSTLPQLVAVSPTFSAPQFLSADVETEVLVRDGEEVIIGGLVRSTSQEVRRGLPLLMDIPILGYLFGKYEESEVKQEVIFFIKASLVTRTDQLPRETFDPAKRR